jgi:predicted transcriptional regulator
MSNGMLIAAGARRRRAATRIRIDIRERIIAERHRLGITATEAARRMGVSRQCYNDLEYRTKDPRVSKLIELVTKVGMDPRVLIGELMERKD